MRLVLDNNIFFSLMKPDSVNSYLFSLLKAEFFAPEYMKMELDRHISECILKSKLSEHEFEIRRKEIEGNIKFVKFQEYKRFLKQAERSLVDKEDSPYVALALSISVAIWSNDEQLKKQSLAEVFTTKEILDKLIKNEI